MNGLEYIFDTNALIYIINGNPCMKPFLDKKAGISVITEIELLSFHGIKKEEEQIIRNLLENFTIYSISKEEKEKTIELRKKYSIKTPDAIIAALSVVHGIPLVTADKGFMKIAEAEVILIDPS